MRHFRLGNLPPNQIVRVNRFRERKFTKYNIIFSLDNLLLVNIVLPQKTKWICHDFTANEDTTTATQNTILKARPYIGGRVIRLFHQIVTSLNPDA